MESKLKIYEVFNEVMTKRDEILRRDRTVSDVNFTVYMHYEFYCECMSEISGGVDSRAHEFFFHGTVMGHDVYICTESAIAGKSHSPFRVFQI